MSMIIILGHYSLKFSFSSLARMRFSPRMHFAIMTLFLTAHAHTLNLDLNLATFAVCLVMLVTLRC